MKRIAALCALVAGLAAPLAAQELPGLFRVVGVAADDVLNIRAAPSADAAIIGALAPDRRGVEVTSTARDGRWGQVLADDRSGWVAMRFLAPEPDDPGVGLPDRLSCAGTEPFWSLDLDMPADRYRFAEYTGDAPERTPRLQWHANLEFGHVRGGALRLADALGGITVVIRPGECSDGMSDFIFGWKALAVDGDGPDARPFTGCCTADFSHLP